MLEGDTAYERAEPNASATLESLRSLGYSTEAAVADLVDNSIAAGAENVRIDITWAGRESFLRIEDDGSGMNEAALREAMRPSSKNPLDARTERDLGRFGMGLKTASLSQARRLVVASRPASSEVPAARCWDLDYVAKVNDWRLLKDVGPVSWGRVAFPRVDHGTVVLWENMDRFVGDVAVEDSRAHGRFLETVAAIEQHLSMVFQRLMTGRRRLRIKLQGNTLKPWDPFLEDEPATQRLQSESVRFLDSTVTLDPFVLPHHDRLSPERYLSGGGFDGKFGWTPMQGFYIYRNKRLVIAGDWLGTHQREVHYQLARIRVDIDNQHDAAWHLDVKKSSARPPASLRSDFKRVALITRQRAAEVYRLRGKVLARQATLPFAFVWRQRVTGGKISYHIDREHPLVRAAIAAVGEGRKQLKAVLDLIEETVPAPMIAMDHAERPLEIAGPFEMRVEADVRDVIRETYRALRRDGLARKSAIERIALMEPFPAFPSLIAELEEIVE